MSHQDQSVALNAVCLKKALCWLVAGIGWSKVKFRDDCTYTPRLLAYTAMLWAWSDEITLVDRFHAVRRIIQFLFPLQQELAGSYQAFIKLLRRWTPRVAPTIFRNRRIHPISRFSENSSVLREQQEDWRSDRASGTIGHMAKRRIYDDELHAQFVTFSCYRRRRLLDHARTRQIVMGMLAAELDHHDGTCCRFVVMPDHVHAIVWFPENQRLSPFMQVWKGRSSRQLKKFVRGQLPEYAKLLDRKEPFWQPKYYPLSLYSEKTALEKLDYMHLNPVRKRKGKEKLPCGN